MEKEFKEMLFDSENLSVGFLDTKYAILRDFSNKVDEFNEKERLEIESIKAKYKEPRNIIANKFEENKKELEEYGYLIRKYSTFELDEKFYDIMDILEEIVSLYKGREYRFEEHILVNKHYYILKPETLEINTLDELNNSKFDGEVLNLTNEKGNKGKICFYEKFGKDILVSDKYKNFECVLNFVDFVVKYRIENKIDAISYLDLKKLEQIFIIKNKDSIKQIYSELAKKSRETLELEISSRERLLENYYNSIDETGDFQNLINSKKNLTGNVLKKIMKETSK